MRLLSGDQSLRTESQLRVILTERTSVRNGAYNYFRRKQPCVLKPIASMPTTPAAHDANARLDRIEAVLQTLTTSIANVAAAQSQASSSCDCNTTASLRPRVPKLRVPSKEPVAYSPASTLASLDVASTHLRQMGELPEATTRQENISKSLQDLSKTMTDIKLKGLSPLEDSTHGGFFVPAEAVGYTLRDSESDAWLAQALVNLLCRIPEYYGARRVYDH